MRGSDFRSFLTVVDWAVQQYKLTAVSVIEIASEIGQDLEKLQYKNVQFWLTL